MAVEPDADSCAGLIERTERALAALLAMSAADAALVRDHSPGRRRPRGHHGPLLDLGDPADVLADEPH